MARGAAIRGTPLVRAVMAAEQARGPMQGQRHAAMGTPENMATLAAEERSGEAAPIQEQQDLLAADEAAADAGLHASG